MRILHIHPAMRSGGIEAMICGLANEMANSNEVYVCSIFMPRDNDTFWNRLDPRVNRLTLSKIKEGFSLRVVFQIRRLIRDGGFDVVHMHGFFYYYALSIFTLNRKKTHYFYTVHSDAAMENGSWERYVFQLKKRGFIKGYVNPITISKASNESFFKIYGINGRVIENGIPRPVISNKPVLVDEMRITDQTKVFLHPGRITKAKNQIVLCKVFARLIKDGFDVVLIIAGSKQDEGIFNEMLPYLNERIRYVGERDDVPELLSYCDGMCLPSIWEGLPITLLESLAVSCIPICTPVGGIVNVIKDGENGFLSASSSFDDYLSTMTRFISLPFDTIERIKDNARKSFDPFDMKRTAQRYLAYYQEKC